MENDQPDQEQPVAPNNESKPVTETTTPEPPVQEAEQAQSPVPQESKNKWRMIVIVVVALLAGGVVSWALISDDDADKTVNSVDDNKTEEMVDDEQVEEIDGLVVPENWDKINVQGVDEFYIPSTFLISEDELGESDPDFKFYDSSTNVYLNIFSTKPSQINIGVISPDLCVFESSVWYDAYFGVDSIVVSENTEKCDDSIVKSSLNDNTTYSTTGGAIGRIQRIVDVVVNDVHFVFWSRISVGPELTEADRDTAENNLENTVDTLVKSFALYN